MLVLCDSFCTSCKVMVAVRQVSRVELREGEGTSLVIDRVGWRGSYYLPRFR